jgi:hypothetical protein
MNKIERLIDGRGLASLLNTNAAEKRSGASLNRNYHKITWVPLDRLSVVWTNAQRPLDQQRVDAIAKVFDADLLGVITVTLANDEGIHHVIDGHHRSRVLFKLFGNVSVPCIVLDAKDPKRAAELFVKCNKERKAPTIFNTYVASVTAGDEVENAVERIVRAEGYRIENSSQPRCIRAVGATLACYRRYGGSTLRHALSILRETWGYDGSATDGPILTGYCAFLAQHGDAVNHKRLVSRITKKLTPGRLLGSARNLHEVRRIPVWQGVKEIITGRYNEGLRSGRV